MKNLLIALLAVPLFSCNSNVDKLKKGQMFYHEFGGGIETFIVKDVSSSGYYCTTTEWMWSATEYVPFCDLRFDGKFKPLGMYPEYGKKPLPNELSKLKIGDKFQMVVSSQLETFIIFARDSTSVMVKDPRLSINEWSMNIPFENYNPHFFKVLTK